MLQGIMTRGSIRVGASVDRRHSRAEPKGPLSPQQQPVQKDIFEDVGSEYVCSATTKQRGQQPKGAGSSDRKRSYFGGAVDDMADLPPLPMKTEDGRNGHAGKEDDDMELEDDGVPVPPPPPPPPPPDGAPEADYYSSLGGYPSQPVR